MSFLPFDIDRDWKQMTNHYSARFNEAMHDGIRKLLSKDIYPILRSGEWKIDQLKQIPPLRGIIRGYCGMTKADLMERWPGPYLVYAGINDQRCFCLELAFENEQEKLIWLMSH